MKIKLKTLKGDAFECEVTPDMPIGKVKELAAASDHGTKGGWEVEGVKLIFQGKVLDNDKDLASYNINEGDFMAIDNLVEMGYQREQVQAAMVAAFMNPDRAVQYLEEGIPQAGDEGDEEMEDEPTPSTWPELAASPSFLAELAAIRDAKPEGVSARRRATHRHDPRRHSASS